MMRFRDPLAYDGAILCGYRQFSDRLLNINRTGGRGTDVARIAIIAHDDPGRLRLRGKGSRWKKGNRRRVGNRNPFRNFFGFVSVELAVAVPIDAELVLIGVEDHIYLAVLLHRGVS